MRDSTRYTTTEQSETKLNMDQKPASQQTTAATAAAAAAATTTKQGTDIYKFSM